MRRSPLIFWLTCLFFMTSGPLTAGDWLFYSGPTHNGHASPDEHAAPWPDSGPPLNWTRALGQGYSSFVAQGEHCLTQYQTALGQYLLCLNIRTGETIWEYRYAAPYEALGIYPGPRSTPTIAGDAVFFTTPNGELTSLSLDRGTLRWSVSFNEKLKGEGTGFGYAASPLAIHDLIVLPVGGPGAAVVAFSAVTGEVVWKSGSDSASYCSTIPISFDGETLLVSYLENVLVIHDLTGRQLCHLPLTSGYDEHAASPLYQEPLLVLAAPFRAGATAYRLSWKSQTSGDRQLLLEQQWHSPQMSNDVMSSILLDDMLIGFDLKDPQSKAHRPSRGTFRALDLQSGNVLWSETQIGQANIVAVGSGLLLLNDQGELLFAEVNRKECLILSKTPVLRDEICWTRPILSSGHLLIRSHSRCFCFDIRSASSTNSIARHSPLPVATHRWSVQLLNGLLSGEREHPVIPLEWEELKMWYLTCLAAIMLPVLVFWGIVFRRIDQARPTMSSIAMLGVLAVAGMVATPLLNSATGTFYFTWPVTIFASLQAAVLTSHAASLPGALSKTRWQARAAGLLLLFLCFGYYFVLRFLGEPMLWGFLIGLLPTFPVCVLAVKMRWISSRFWARSILLIVGFSVLFWGGHLLAQWKMIPTAALQSDTARSSATS